MFFLRSALEQSKTCRISLKISGSFSGYLKTCSLSRERRKKDNKAARSKGLFGLVVVGSRFKGPEGNIRAISGVYEGEPLGVQP